jgi:glycosyltransferase involved in cell wall biosynthesis
MRLLGIDRYEHYYEQLLSRFDHVNRFDYVIALSDFVKRTYEQVGFPAERIFVAYPDVDIRRFTPARKRGNVFRVMYMAYTKPLKGLQYLLKAWDDIKLPDAELVIVGEYATGMPDILKKRFAEIAQRNSNIRWIGDTQRAEDLYHEASVFVLPSLSEGFGKVTLEAMASGLPVITTENAAGIVEDGKTGFVVPIRNARAIGEKIEYLYHDREALVQMGENARYAAEHKKPFGEAVFDIYRAIVLRENIV